MSAVREVSEAYEHGDEEKLNHIVSLVRLWSFLTALLGMLVCIVFSPFLNSFTFFLGRSYASFYIAFSYGCHDGNTGGELPFLKVPAD